MNTRRTLSQIGVVTLLALLLAFVSACASALQKKEAAYVAPMEMPAEVEMIGKSVVETVAVQEAGLPSAYEQSVKPVAVERMVIRNANLSIVVADPAASMDAIGKLAERMGGYVVSAVLSQSQLENGREVPRASITIRVPAERFDEAIQSIRAESDRLPLNETINSQDVTSEYTDLASRLRNLEAAEAQLTEIMESAANTEDVLSVYNELVRVREQIEVIKGQMQYYEQSAALSAISVELIANEAVQPLTIGSWQPGGVARKAIQTLINTLQALVDVVIWLVLLVLPVLLAIALMFGVPIFLIVWGVRLWRRRRRARQQRLISPE